MKVLRSGSGDTFLLGCSESECEGLAIQIMALKNGAFLAIEIGTVEEPSAVVIVRVDDEAETAGALAAVAEQFGVSAATAAELAFDAAETDAATDEAGQ